MTPKKTELHHLVHAEFDSGADAVDFFGALRKIADRIATAIEGIDKTLVKMESLLEKIDGQTKK